MFKASFFLYPGELFAQAPVNEYPGVEVESVMDSSRYFVVKIVDPSGKMFLFQQLHIETTSLNNSHVYSCLLLFYWSSRFAIFHE